MGTENNEADPGSSKPSLDDPELRDIQERISRLKPTPSGSPLFARGVALATSMGFVLAGCLVGGFFLGHIVAERTGYKMFDVLGLVLGLVLALVALTKMLRPFLKNQD